MSRIAPLAAAVALMSYGPALAQDGPPPPQVAVVLVGIDGVQPHEPSQTLLDAIDQDAGTSGWFTVVDAAVEPGAFTACPLDPNAEACTRKVLAALAPLSAPRVVVIARPGPGFGFGWRCVGQGPADTRAERQFVGFDTMHWRDPASGGWRADREAAAACILAAAAESDW